MAESTDGSTGSVPLEVLAEAVAKVSYKGLDLSHLQATKAGRL